jgi:hypothetical protein
VVKTTSPINRRRTSRMFIRRLRWRHGEPADPG